MAGSGGQLTLVTLHVVNCTACRSRERPDKTPGPCGGMATFLAKPGETKWEVTVDIPFAIGELYQRRKDIHGRFGGQQQGGISTPADQPFIFLFTGEGGAHLYHHDGWHDDGVFHYTGEGQVGDQRFIAGNKAIRDHLVNGKDLLLFEKLPAQVRFAGTFSCTSYSFKDGPDRDGHSRKEIVFHLVRAEDATAVAAPVEEGPIVTPTPPSLDQLRARALDAAHSGPSEGNGKQGRRTYYKRSKDVRDYVLARAAGVCEECGLPAPFKRLDGSPYLEPHHIRRVADGGPDHPSSVGAICPTCHRRIHYGSDGAEYNRRLAEAIRLKEKTPVR